MPALLAILESGIPSHCHAAVANFISDSHFYLSHRGCSIVVGDKSVLDKELEELIINIIERITSSRKSCHLCYAIGYSACKSLVSQGDTVHRTVDLAFCPPRG